MGLDPVKGHEQAGVRPALVLSVDTFNASAAGLVTVLPITGTQRALGTRVDVAPPEGGLVKPSYIICEQTRTVSAHRLVKGPLGVVTAATMGRVEGIVRVLLGL